MKLKNFIHKLADVFTGGSNRRFFVLPFLYCIVNGYFILAGLMWFSFVTIIITSLTIKYRDAKYDCLSNIEQKKIIRDKKLRKLLK